jgi:hypothetical protein
MDRAADAMDKPVFFNTIHCLSGTHCKRCRTPSETFWRYSLSKAFDVGDTINFDCPHNEVWIGYAPPKIPVRRHKPASKQLTGYSRWKCGDFFALAIARTLGKKYPPRCCWCQQLRADMNYWGWWQSLLRFSLIREKMKENAQRLGAEVTLVQLLRGALSVAVGFSLSDCTHS